MAMSSMRERILEALKTRPMSKPELATRFGIKLAPFTAIPISEDEDQLGKALSSLQTSIVVSKGKNKFIVRKGPVDVIYDSTRVGLDAYVNVLLED
jgi:hypothetical protein